MPPPGPMETPAIERIQGTTTNTTSVTLRTTTTTRLNTVEVCHERGRNPIVTSGARVSSHGAVADGAGAGAGAVVLVLVVAGGGSGMYAVVNALLQPRQKSCPGSRTTPHSGQFNRRALPRSWLRRLAGA